MPQGKPNYPKPRQSRAAKRWFSRRTRYTLTSAMISEWQQHSTPIWHFYSQLEHNLKEKARQFWSGKIKALR